MIVLPILNGSPEWFEARRGMITGSNFKTVLTGDKAKNWPGESAIKYMHKVASERMGDEEEEVESFAMRRGSLLEPDALEAYADLMMRDVEPASFIAHDTLPISCTPDGMLSDREGRGTVECKCRSAALHAGYIIAGRPTDADLFQVQGNLWLSGFDWCDFVSYRPLLRDESKRLVVFRIYRNEEIITSLALKLPKVVDMVQEFAAKLGVSDWVPYHRRPVQPSTDNGDEHATVEAGD